MLTEQPSYNKVTLDGLASVLRSRVQRAARGESNVKGTKTAVLLGAGASVSAGIPLASQVVQEIRREFPELVRGCEPTYPAHMARLPSADITNLLRKYIDDATVNAAHLFLAQLVRVGYIDRILTTNFDSLAIQGLLLVNERPFIYDLANLKVFTPGHVTAPAVIHLHGQFGGFVNLNTEEEFTKLGDLVRDVLRDTLAERALIVVGYGGRNDPVFEQLCEYGNQYGEYHQGLYWVSHTDAEPPQHVRKRLLGDTTRRAYYLRDYDADSFFMTLARSLECGLPQIVEYPFSFLKDTVRRIGRLHSGRRADDLIGGTHKLIEFAIECHEEDKRCARGRREFADRRSAKIEKEAQDIREAGRVDKIQQLLFKARKYKVPIAIELAARALSEHGERLLKEAREYPSDRGEEKALKALRCYERASRVQPEFREAHCCCGDALRFIAMYREAARRDALFVKAFEKYEQATKYEGLGQEEYRVYDAAVELVDLDPALPESIPRAYVKWADALVELASQKKGDERASLLRDAEAKLGYAMAMQPGLPDVQDKLKRVAGLRKGGAMPPPQAWARLTADLFER